MRSITLKNVILSLVFFVSSIVLVALLTLDLFGILLMIGGLMSADINLGLAVTTGLTGLILVVACNWLIRLLTFKLTVLIASRYYKV